MLSLNKGKPIFFQVSKDDLKKLETIKFEPNGRGKSDIDVENKLSLLTKRDWKTIKKKHQMSAYNIEQLKRHIKNSSRDKITSGVMLAAYDTCDCICDDVLKNSLIFDDNIYNRTELIPVAKKFTVISIIGPSGSGKSTMAAKIIQKSMKKDDTIWLLSRQLNELDPALKPLEDNIQKIDFEDLENLPELEDLENGWLFVDDIEGINKRTREYLFDFIDTVVTTGRKLNVRIIFSSHLMGGYLMRHVLNESRVRIVFPQSNKWKIRQELRLKYGLPTAVIDNMFEAVKHDQSRSLIFQTSTPFLYATERRVVLL